MEEHHYFYGKPVFRKRQQKHIQKLLQKYRDEPPTEELKKKIWQELQQEKHEGRITIPFKVQMRKDPLGIFPDVIEIALDTKV